MAEEKDTQAGDRSEATSAVKDTLGGLAATGAAAVATDTESFTTNAMSAILYELEASDMAERRARREDVREFAANMRTDFTNMKDELGSFLAGTQQPTAPPEEPIKLHQTLLDDLKGSADEDFDKRYIAQQKLAHTEATTLFKSFESRGGFNAGLKNLCRLGLPVLEAHQRELERLDQA
jgi:putative membrane protein